MQNTESGKYYAAKRKQTGYSAFLQKKRIRKTVPFSALNGAFSIYFFFTHDLAFFTDLIAIFYHRKSAPWAAVPKGEHLIRVIDDLFIPHDRSASSVLCVFGQKFGQFQRIFVRVLSGARIYPFCAARNDLADSWRKIFLEICNDQISRSDYCYFHFLLLFKHIMYLLNT